MSDAHTPVTLRQKIGLVIFVIFVAGLTDSYWRGRGELPLLGPVSIWVVALVGSVGGALSFLLVGQKPETRRIGMLAGALAAFGGIVAFHFVYGGVSRAGPERVFVGLAGMAPGLLLGHLLVRRFERKPEEALPPTG